MKAKIIAVFGAGRVSEKDWQYDLARQCGRLIAESGHALLTGGLGGVMEAASKGAKEASGLTIGILPGDRHSTPANPYIDVPIYTGMGEARNILNVKSCDAAIAIGGEYGTLSEIALALKTGCPIVLLSSWSFHPQTEIVKEQAGYSLATSAAEAVSKILALLAN